MKYIISGLIIFLLSGNLILKAQDANPIIVDEIIAKVDNYIVLKSDLEGRYLDALANGVSPTPDLKCLILGSMIREKLMVAHAEIDSIIVSDVEVELDLERRISMILQQYNGNEEMLIQYYGKTMEDIRLELRDQVKEQMVVNRMQQFLTEDINVTPSEVRKFFKRIPSDSLPFYDMEVEVAEIVKKVEAGESEYEKARAKLIDIRRRVVNGEDFGEMAKQFSQGPTGPNGGDLGRVKRGSMVPEFEAEALRLKPGEVSMPVKTEFGLHLIKLEERQGNEYHSRHILLIPQPTETDIQNAEKFLDSLRNLALTVDTINFEQLVKEHSESDETSGSGGFFMDPSGSKRISVRNLQPEIYFAVDSMEVGKISMPLRYKTHQGKDAVRLLFYKSNNPPHQANLEDDWQKIMNAALMEKKNNKIFNWFEKAKNNVFINIDDEYTSCGILN